MEGWCDKGNSFVKSMWQSALAKIHIYIYIYIILYIDNDAVNNIAKGAIVIFPVVLEEAAGHCPEERGKPER